MQRYECIYHLVLLYKYYKNSIFHKYCDIVRIIFFFPWDFKYLISKQKLEQVVKSLSSIHCFQLWLIREFLRTYILDCKIISGTNQKIRANKPVFLETPSSTHLPPLFLNNFIHLPQVIACYNGADTSDVYSKSMYTCFPFLAN